MGINIINNWTTKEHRSGWRYVMRLLNLLSDNNGILFDGFVDKTFAWINHPIPYDEPWIGFIHQPHSMPSKIGRYWRGPRHIFKLDAWKKSEKFCKGLFCFSNYFKEWLVKNTDIPICQLTHPTRDAGIKFSIDRFCANPNKQIIQVGQYLRRVSSIYQFPTENYELTVLALDGFDKNLNDEMLFYGIDIDKSRVKKIQRVPDRHYDNLLSENIAFMHLYDCSASNAVLECIVRNTPLLINPLPAVVEYLGKGYPFYFNTLEEASRKADNLELVKKTTDYLAGNPIKEKLSGRYFINSFIGSEIYR